MTGNLELVSNYLEIIVQCRLFETKFIKMILINVLSTVLHSV